MNGLGNKEIMADNIQRLMDENNINRKDLSEAIGVPYTTVCDWVNQKTYPRIDKIELMANYFNVSKADLVERFEERTKYYYNGMAGELAQEILERPELKILFDAARDVSAEDIQLIVDMVERMKK